LNSSKTQAVFFTKRRTRELVTSELLLDGHSILWENRAICIKRWHLPLMESIFLVRFRRWSGFSIPSKFVAWQACAEAHKNWLQILQNKCQKLILNLSRYHSPSDVHEQVNCKLISERLESIHERFQNRLLFVDNPLINENYQGTSP
jgi:hypothetical protein